MIRKSESLPLKTASGDDFLLENKYILKSFTDKSTSGDIFPFKIRKSESLFLKTISGAVLLLQY